MLIQVHLYTPHNICGMLLVTAFGIAISPSDIPSVCRLSQLAACDKRSEKPVCKAQLTFGKPKVYKQAHK